MKFIALFLLLLVVFVVSITLGANNDYVVTFNYLLGQVDCRLSTLLAILFGSGFMIGWLLTGIFYLKTQVRLKVTRRNLNKLQKKYDDIMSEQQKSQLINKL